MASRLRGRVILVRLSAGLVALSAVLFVRPATPAAAVVVTPNCPWQTKLDANTTNVLFPDQNANYSILLYPIVGTAGLTIDGRYPHARYMSFTTYNNQTQAIDGVNDVHVDPLDGNRADNPFIAGNRRNTDGSVRDYRVQVIPGTRPAGEVHNRVYTTSPDSDPPRNTGHSNAVMYIVIYGPYRPDKGLDPGGGEPLPAVTGDLVGGATRLLDSSGCTTKPDPNLGVNDLLTGTSLPQLVPGGPCYPGVDPPAWHKFTNLATATAYTTDNCLTGSSISGPAVSVTDTLPKGGFLENLDNKYVSAVLNADAYGPLVVISSRVPTTPDTFNGAPVMGSGQLRYWSMCSNDLATTRFWGCVMDDGLTRLDPQGDYCLVLSNPANRPRNANAAHRVNWLPYGPMHSSVLIERNMLPEPTFTYSIQNATPGQEIQGLGPYYPSAKYTSVTDFERSGCSGFRGTSLSAHTTALGAVALPDTSGPGPGTSLPLVLCGLLLALLSALRYTLPTPGARP